MKLLQDQNQTNVARRAPPSPDKEESIHAHE